jgi:non-ribosomal peptide synthetase component F
VVVFENFPVDRAVAERGHALGVQVKQIQTYVQPDQALAVVVTPAQRLGVRLLYDRNRLTDSMVEGVFCQFERMLRVLGESADAGAVGELELSSPAEQAAVAALSRGPSLTPRPDASVSQAFTRQASETPDTVALVHGPEHVSYAALNQRADRMARKLAGLGVRAEALVGLNLSRSIEQWVLVLAVWKAGGAYVALDPEYPRERLDFIVEFPAPGPEERRALWQSHLGDKTALDPAHLNQISALIDVSGGHIRNAVLAAAVRASHENRPIEYADVLAGVDGELRKLGRQMSVQLKHERSRAVPPPPSKTQS